jgi:hypothetical protein
MRRTVDVTHRTEKRSHKLRDRFTSEHRCDPNSSIHVIAGGAKFCLRCSMNDWSEMQPMTPAKRKQNWSKHPPGKSGRLRY